MNPLLRAPCAALALLAAAASAHAVTTIKQRTDAATNAAATDPSCVAIASGTGTVGKGFYWSIGDASGLRADGRVGRSPPGAGTTMDIASASKWVYGAYVAQQRRGALTPTDVKYLTFVSGYTDFNACAADQTVAQCLAFPGNEGYHLAYDGRFYYGGGHMQKHAVDNGLGPDGDARLAADVNQPLRTGFDYAQPQLAGGIETTPALYAQFLQQLVGGQLAMSALLGADAVCTNKTICPKLAASSPLDGTVYGGAKFHYAIGHWVEDDLAYSDGAFSSPGAHGFYPWIDAGAQWWGVLARDVEDGSEAIPFVDSMLCGRRIRAAWLNPPR